MTVSYLNCINRSNYVCQVAEDNKVVLYSLGYIMEQENERKSRSWLLRQKLLLNTLPPPPTQHSQNSLVFLLYEQQVNDGGLESGVGAYYCTTKGPSAWVSFNPYSMPTVYYILYKYSSRLADFHDF
jgi:hypothetical protein